MLTDFRAMKGKTLSLDELYAAEISALLNPLPSFQIQAYFDDLISKRQCNGLRVKQNGELGKGACTGINFKEGEMILKDQMIVGSQHPSNKIDCLVCSYCFRFIGSIELQIGRKLYLQEMGLSSNNECHGSMSDEDDDSRMINNDAAGGCSTSSPTNNLPLPKEVVDSLMNCQLRLPYSEKFSLPSAVPCDGGCGEAYYCSKSCATTDWEHCHSLLCSGERSLSLCKKALSRFIDHANNTNDIFLLAAKAISFTVLRYRKLKENHLNNMHCVDARRNGSGVVDLPLLLEAWKPLSMGYKRRWWDCVALPADVEESDEVEFRTQIKQMASTSLELLRDAMFDDECAPLFSLEIYGNIIGMFELNNLDLVVASPVEDYFLYIDGLPSSHKNQAEAITRPILDALGEDYSVCCQGTAFYPLQSCMNHSCCPNAKAFKRDEDRDGQATIIASRSIEAGEEVTISYIDEDLPYEERQALLADYGFRCNCRRCSEEA